MKGLRRNDDAMKYLAGIKKNPQKLKYIALSYTKKEVNLRSSPLFKDLSNFTNVLAFLKPSPLLMKRTYKCHYYLGYPFVQEFYH